MFNSEKSSDLLLIAMSADKEICIFWILRYILIWIKTITIITSLLYPIVDNDNTFFNIFIWSWFVYIVYWGSNPPTPCEKCLKFKYIKTTNSFNQLCQIGRYNINCGFGSLASMQNAYEDYLIFRLRYREETQKRWIHIANLN